MTRCRVRTCGEPLDSGQILPFCTSCQTCLRWAFLGGAFVMGAAFKLLGLL